MKPLFPAPTPRPIDLTREHWQPYYREPLTDDDCCEIISNVSAASAILCEWRDARRTATAAASALPDPSTAPAPATPRTPPRAGPPRPRQ